MMFPLGHCVQAEEGLEVTELPEPAFLDFEVEDRLASGLICEMQGVASPDVPVDARRSRMANIYVEDQRAISPFITGDGFRATLRGFL
ncbi:MAG: hypothetical protein AAGF97_08385, partial [Planctomycetota bacterium]